MYVRKKLYFCTQIEKRLALRNESKNKNITSNNNTMKHKNLLLLALLVASLPACTRKTETTAKHSDFQIEESVNGYFFLRDMEAAERFREQPYDETYFYELDPVTNMIQHPFALYVNKKGDEYLAAMFHEGTSLWWFAEFVIGKLEANTFPPDVKTIETDFASFVTQSGLCLGMDSLTVKSIKGEPFARRGNTFYYWHDSADSEFTDEEYFDRDGMPLHEYYMRLYFEEGKLINICFGYEYP